MTSTNKTPMLTKFLNGHRTKDKQEITHTRIGNPELDPFREKNEDYY